MTDFSDDLARDEVFALAAEAFDTGLALVTLVVNRDDSAVGAMTGGMTWSELHGAAFGVALVCRQLIHDHGIDWPMFARELLVANPFREQLA